MHRVPTKSGIVPLETFSFFFLSYSPLNPGFSLERGEKKKSFKLMNFCVLGKRNTSCAVTPDLSSTVPPTVEV